MPPHPPPYKRLRFAGGVLALLAVGYLAGRLESSLFRTPRPSVAVSPTPGGAVPRVPFGGAPGAPAAETAVAEAGSHDPQVEWTDFQRRPAGAARERAIADFLRRLAATDPAGALALARAENNFRVRQSLVVASLEGWAGRDPAASLAWASENLFETNRREAIEAVIEAGMVLPGELSAAVRSMIAADADGAGADYGRMLIAAMARREDFEGALGFAADAPLAGKEYLIGAALYSWSQYRPEEAAAALEKFTDPAARNEGLHGLIIGWAANEPVNLLKYAATLPPGPVRSQAFNEALQNWVAHDPVGASAWLDEHESAPELDPGAAKLATSPFLVENDVETALGWAHSVADPEQRSIALVDVIQQWATHDPAAARAYAERLPGLQPAYREQLMKNLSAPPDVPAR